ncbi:DUF3099 domain-containing protein [Nocardioides taihuensis]|uniref:DUF3099 domain-containing protein n=1 Tax=Nocardioides taihuensis TaxID=1835606 RepID=A0ABW0BI16_9ACTN
MVWQRGQADEPVRITTAATSPQADISARQRRYVISMTIRTLCFVGAVVVGAGWLRWVLVAGAVLLPYVAVVMANAVGTKSDELDLRDADFRRGELGTPRENGSTTR